MYYEPFKNPVIVHLFLHIIFYLLFQYELTNALGGQKLLVRYSVLHQTSVFKNMKTWDLKVAGQDHHQGSSAKLMNEDAAALSPTLHPDG